MPLHARTLRIGRRALAAALLLAGSCLAAPLAAQLPADSLHAALTGRWRGSLTYRDYRDPTRRVTLPTLLGVTSAPAGGVRLVYTYDDGPGKTVYDTTVVFARTPVAPGGSIRWGAEADTATVFRVLSVDTASGGVRLVLEREGSDNDAPATLRETVTLTPGELRVLKEVRPADAAAFAFRHEYRFAREP